MTKSIGREQHIRLFFEGRVLRFRAGSIINSVVNRGRSFLARRSRAGDQAVSSKYAMLRYRIFLHVKASFGHNSTILLCYRVGERAGSQ